MSFLISSVLSKRFCPDLFVCRRASYLADSEVWHPQLLRRTQDVDSTREEDHNSLTLHNGSVVLQKSPGPDGQWDSLWTVSIPASRARIVVPCTTAPDLATLGGQETYVH